MLTQEHGIPLAIIVDDANRHDMKLVEATLDDLKLDRPTPTTQMSQGLCLDKGYDYAEVRQLIEQRHFTPHIRARGEAAKKISREAGFRARRWVVERTHSWMNRFRGVLVRWPKKANHYLALLHLVCAIITWRATGLLR